MMIIKRNTLINYLNSKIRPRYRKHDGAHDEKHLDEVLEKALELANYYGVREDMCMCCAYYHDIGLDLGREGHELRSADYMRKDKNLLRWFEEDEIEEMAEAVEDHRASLRGEPRSLLGKIISDADRIMIPERVIERSFRFNSEKYPEKTEEEVLDIVYNYLKKKYGDGGYARMNLQYKPFLDQRNRFKAILRNRKLFDEIAYNIKDKQFSEETRIRKMKGKLILDDIGTATGIHPLYRKVKEKITGEKTLYHYTPSKNVESIMKDGFDPGYDTYGDRFKASIGKDIDRGIYFGNQSKSIPRLTSINRYKMTKDRIRKGKDIREGWDDPGAMITVKIPMKDYSKMKRRESDPMSDYNDHNFYYKNNRRYREEYDSKGKIGKLLMKGRTRLNNQHLKKDVVLMQEKVDPRYITKIDRNWS